MRIGIFGTGIVGTTLGSGFITAGDEVRIGSRTAGNPSAADWVRTNGRSASQGTFADAAQYGEILLNCTAGSASLDALKLAGKENMKGKMLIDVANPLDVSKGMPPALTVCNTDSLGEQIQREFPDVTVVKALNTVNCSVMVNPSLVPGQHDLFICGNNQSAKAEVMELLKNRFGWKSFVDLGDISGARMMEMYVTLWVRLYGQFKSPNFNIRIVK